MSYPVLALCRASRRSLLLPLILTTVVAGCAVGPDYQQPAQPDTDAYHIHQQTAGEHTAGHKTIPEQAFQKAGDVRSDWYRVFGSDKLDRLIGQAINDSPTLAAGQARIKAAHEAVKTSKSDLYPQLNVGGGYSRNRVTGSEFGTNNAEFTNVFNLYQGQATASYDLDLFGKTRRQIEQRSAQLNEQKFSVINTYITLINNIVATAVAEAGINAALDTSHQIIEAQESSLQVVRKQIRYGVAIDADASQIRTQLARTRASLEPLRKQKVLAVNRLAVLTGTPPGQFSDPGFSLDEIQLPTQLPVSVPAQLVSQRPDILASASAVHAASAQIGVATANLLPDLSISGSYGRSALTPSDLTDPAFALYSLGAQLSAPIFAGGRLRAEKRQATDLYVAALADYRATSLAAFGEVANSLRSIESDARALVAQQSAVDAARDNLKTVKAQLHNGAADYVALYTAQAQYRNAKLRYTDARVLRYADTADLFKALGGGWWNASNLPLPDNNSDDKTTAQTAALK